MGSLIAIGSRFLGWKGFTSWKFWAGAAFAAMFGWVVITNIHLNSVIADQARDQAQVEAQLGDALEKNQELNRVVARLRVGQFVDEGVVLSNQAEIDRLRNEHDTRVEEVRKKGSSGPASSAAICAITRVCDR